MSTGLTEPHTPSEKWELEEAREKGGLIPLLTHQEPSEHLHCTSARLPAAAVSVLVELEVLSGRGDQAHIRIDEQQTHSPYERVKGVRKGLGQGVPVLPLHKSFSLPSASWAVPKQIILSSMPDGARSVFSNSCLCLPRHLHPLRSLPRH